MTNPLTFDYYEIWPCIEIGGATLPLTVRWRESDCLSGHMVEDAKAVAASHEGAFWTLYGVGGGVATAIGDFTSFDAAYEVMQAILLPIRWALDGPGVVPCAALDALEDILNQSTNDERL